ncbi:flagellar FliL protein [Anaerosolibacter carboniphilus]|uniref:Flagellar protein FliL n=1 Tax=Anaerosolibacter carboniphilus TaxID=1417629 RepID=A0A841KRW7_9FIRM|nr:flagellar basal body-associated FliL family protein [Anaerosolibacter carboniphilus]MBB6216484.1 flagellar FliL protein [Anaerosolibacter carboniphilus]
MTVKKVMLFSIVGFLVTAIIFGGVFYFAVYKTPEKTVKEVKTFSYPIGELYSNVKDSRKILKANVVIETLDEKIQGKLEPNKSKITNSILEVLRSKDESSLAGEKGQQALRTEVLKAVKQIVDSDKITNVYFVEFIVQ